MAGAQGRTATQAYLGLDGSATSCHPPRMRVGLLPLVIAAVLTLAVTLLGASCGGSADPAGEDRITSGVMSDARAGRCSWRRVSAPRLKGAMLYAVAAATPSAVWVVGTAAGPFQNPPALIERWDGGRWIVERSPVRRAFLQDVDARTPSGAWAVGSSKAPGVVILERDTSGWRRVASPPFRLSDATAVSVARDGSVSVLAVADEHIVLSRISGRWKRLPPVPDAINLYDLVALSDNNVWVVGDTVNDSDDRRTFAARWNGKTWKVFPTPNPGVDPRPRGPDAGASLYAVDAVSAQSVWAAGGTDQGGLVLRWKANQGWKALPLPPTVKLIGTIDATSDRNVWIGGRASSLEKALEHWDGRRWRTMRSANGPTETVFGGLTALTRDDAWAVSHTDAAASIERYACSRQ